MIISNAISPFQELIAYETLWAREGYTVKKVAEALKGTNFPSRADFSLIDLEVQNKIKEFINKVQKNFSIITAENYQYPKELEDSENQIKLLYYRGDLGLLESSKKISIVGTRQISKDGIKRTKQLSKKLTEKGYTIVSGLAEGVDTVAMTEAIKNKGNVIGVIGTPINEYYPRENRELQEYIANRYLLLSHVPMYKYSNQSFNTKRFYFPERNVTMAAVSDATIIVEASDTSGTLTQARACLSMNRKLFILNSCFENPNITWPATYEKRGAIRVRHIDDILDNL
ncbi:DNA-processing protein DprA [Aliarcobacter butzleri]|uniref:DNA-processing protein DprA n=1 Tax=Aliarcobacter butzleri TaxID=28197 RepID=UPI002B246C8C|nr:DNA-processing protein DprA [Aliarcobacter butzleri]